jgi:hypothetical protein
VIDWSRLAHPGPANGTVAERALMLVTCRCPARFQYFSNSHDRADYAHFANRGIGRSSDIWDNRRTTVR